MKSTIPLNAPNQATIRDYAHLKSLTERSPCKEDSYNDEEDNSEDKTEDDDDVGEEVSNQLVHSRTHNEGSLMSPAEKKYLIPKVKLPQ
jgi:ABC-type Zn2+ transport system substrate-binding protein/surface adhesin